MKVSEIHLCTASRPVIITPESSTDSPTFSARMASSEMGIVNLVVMVCLPLLVYHVVAGNSHLAPPVGPAHIGNGDEERRGKPVCSGDLGTQHGRFTAKAHWSNAQ